eukprot:264323-Pelagomonas_calceolata.AAC.1
MNNCIQKWLLRFLRSMLGLRTSTPSWVSSVSVQSNLFNSTGSEPVHAFIILSLIATALYFTSFFMRTSPSALGIPPAGHPIYCLP